MTMFQYKIKDGNKNTTKNVLLLIIDNNISIYELPAYDIVNAKVPKNKYAIKAFYRTPDST